ncbi:MAG: TldD/PmbA family protein [Promethearchaeota archaeon]
MSDKLDFYSLSKYTFNLLEQKSKEFKCAELYFSKSDYVAIEIEENSVKNSETGNDIGGSIRIFDNRGSLGFAITNKINKKTLGRMVTNALKLMKSGTEDAEFKDLPSHSNSYPQVKGLYDDELKNIRLEDSLNYVKELINICKEDELAISQSAEFSSTYAKTYIFNTNGIEINGKDTICTIVSNMIVKDKTSNETSFGYDWQSERTLKKINATDIAKNALNEAKGNLNRVKIKSKKLPLILTPTGTINLILRPIASAINAESFQYNRSFLVGKKNQIIGSDYLNVNDDALIDNAAGSSNFDGEGVPCKNKKLFEKGKFLETGLLHNSYTAGKDNIESTGNAARASYASIPSIGISNIILHPGNSPKDEIFKDVKEGILLKSTGDSPNMATGDFSGLILQGNLIKNGEIKDPLNETMFAINMLELFKNIEAVSKEFKVYGSFHAPYVKLKEVQIIGSA